MKLSSRQLIVFAAMIGFCGLGIPLSGSVGDALGVLCFTAGLLLTLFLVLADVELFTRIFVVVLLGLPALAALALLGEGEMLPLYVGGLAVVAGVFLPIRHYTGSIGLPRGEEDARRSPSLGDLFSLVTYYAVLLGLFVASGYLPVLIVFGLMQAFVCLGPMLLLAQPLPTRILGGVFTACLVAVAALMIASAVGHRSPEVWREIMLLLSPAVACTALWASGYQLRR